MEIHPFHWGLIAGVAIGWFTAGIVATMAVIRGEIRETRLRKRQVTWMNEAARGGRG